MSVCVHRPGDHRDLAQPQCQLAGVTGFSSSYITPSLVRHTLQTADSLMCCCCFDFEALGSGSQLKRDKQQTQITQRMQEIKDI